MYQTEAGEVNKAREPGSNIRVDRLRRSTGRKSCIATKGLVAEITNREEETNMGDNLKVKELSCGSKWTKETQVV